MGWTEYTYKLLLETEGDDHFASLEDAGFDESPQFNTRRKWSALKTKNPEYLESLKNREDMSRDFIMENVVSIDDEICT